MEEEEPRPLWSSARPPSSEAEAKGGRRARQVRKRGGVVARGPADQSDPASSVGPRPPSPFLPPSLDQIKEKEDKGK